MGAPPGRPDLTAVGPTTDAAAATSTSIDVLRLLRPVQWLKNGLVALPVLASHRFGPEELLATAGAFAALCLAASGIYALNDVLDREADARHPVKRRRPVAAGRLDVGAALGAGAAALGGGLLLAAAQGLPLLGAVSAYLAVAALYLAWGKRQPILDIALLTLLYVLRVMAGGLATGIPASAWLLAFAMFFFFALAAAKRQGELVLCRAQGEDAMAGRGYRAADLPLLGTMALASGYVSVLVLALYLQSDQVALLYSDPAPLWGVCLIVLFWISRLVFLSHRGEVHSDPVVFAVGDPVTLGCLAALPALAVLAV